MARQQCTSLITLGTPHVVSPFALVDQTRGLIQDIENTPSCNPTTLKEQHGIHITCVCSKGITGRVSVGATIDEWIASASYIPLAGTFNTQGDGIVPLDVAFLQNTNHVIVENNNNNDDSRVILHSHVLPTPWNLWNGKAPSIPLWSTTSSGGDNKSNKYLSYVSPGVVSQWASYIR
jgi:hypothetical protein